MPKRLQHKPLICALLGGLLLSLPLAQAEITSQSLEPVTLDQTKITKPALEKTGLPPDRSNQAGTFRREHYTLKTTYGRYAQLKIEEKPIALQGSLKEGSRAFLYTVQNNSADPLVLTLHNTLTPEEAMKEAQNDRRFWVFAPVVLLPGSIYAAYKILSFPNSLLEMGDSTSKGEYVTAFTLFSLLLSPITVPLSALTVAGGAIATVVLIPIALVKTPINLAMAKSNDRLAREQLKSSDFKQDQATLSIPAGQAVQFAILGKKHPDREQIPLFTIVSSHEVSP